MTHRPLCSWILVTALWICGATVGGDALLAQTSKPKGPTSKPKAAVLDLGTFSVPLGKDWVKERPSSSMRAGQAQLPAPAQDGQAAEMVVFHFPGGGSIAANVNRWKNQFVKPDGMSEADFARQSSTTADTLPVTLLQVQGRYIGSRMPGRPAPKPIADARMIAAIIETSKGPYFIKITGPRGTVDHHQKAIDSMIQGLKRGAAEPKGKKKSPTSRPRG